MTKKYLLMVLLLLLVMVLLGPAMIAAQELDGSSQDKAIQIQATNEDQLLQLTERWYTFTIPEPSYQGTESLNMDMFYENGQLIISSDITRYPYVDFYLYRVTGGQLSQVGSGKNWTGRIEGGNQYWVKVTNESDYIVDYTLVYDSNYSPPEEVEEIEEPEVLEVEVETVPQEVAIVPEVSQPSGLAQVTADGATPAEATEFSLTDLTRGQVEGETTGWRAISFDDPGNTNERQHLTITCFATPFDGNTVRQVQLRLYAIGAAQEWDGHSLDDLEELGAVELNIRHNMASAFGDGNAPAQFIWDGWVTAGDEYVLAVKNGTDLEIDYWCFPQQMDNAELGEKSVHVIPNFEVGEAPSNPLKLEVNTEANVTTDQQLWYSFVLNDPGDGQLLEHVTIDMSFTPNNGAQGYNDAYRVNFDVYNAADLDYWSHTNFDNTQIQSFGNGSRVVRDNNPDTGEMTWDGWVVDGNTYYVQVRNGARYPIDAKIVVTPLTAPIFAVQTAGTVQSTGIQ